MNRLNKTMNLRNEICSAIREALSGPTPEDSDLIRIAELAEKWIPSEPSTDWEGILSLDPETRDGLMSLLDFTDQQSLNSSIQAKRGFNVMIESMIRSGWKGSLEVGYSEDGFLQVRDSFDQVSLQPWVSSIFKVAKQMLGSADAGIWPTDHLVFYWPLEKPLLKGRLRIRHEIPELTLRLEPLEEINGTGLESDIEYWCGDDWIGGKTLRSDECELLVNLKPGWPYVFSMRTPEPNLLKINCQPHQFSDAELRMVAILRVLAGDIRGGFGLVRDRLVPPTKAFRWAMALVSQCLPDPALEPGYSAVRDVATQDEIKESINDLFGSLATGWLSESGRKKSTEDLEASLKELDDSISQGFLLSLKGNYSEAIDVWMDADLSEEGGRYVVGARIIATQLQSKTYISDSEIPSFEEEEIEATLRCANALVHRTTLPEEDPDQLAELLIKACR